MVTEPTVAGGEGLIGQRRRRHRHKHRPTTSSMNDDDGEDILSPLIVIPTPRMSTPIFSKSASGDSTYLSSQSQSLSSPYSINSPPPRISSTRSCREDHLNNHREADHHYQIHNQLEDTISHNDNNVEEDDDSRSKSSFLSKASNTLKKKLSAKQGKKSTRRCDPNDDDNNIDKHNNYETRGNEYHKLGISNQVGENQVHRISSVRRKEEGGGSSSSVRTKEGRDPSPTHDHGDDDEYYSNHRHHHHHRHRHYEIKNDEDVDDGEYTHNDNSTLSTTSTPTHTGLPSRERVPVVHQQHQQQQHQQRQQPVERHGHRRDHPPSSPLNLVVEGPQPLSPGGKHIEEPPRKSSGDKHEGVRGKHEMMSIRQQYTAADPSQQFRIPREVVATTTTKAVDKIQMVGQETQKVNRGVEQNALAPVQGNEGISEDNDVKKDDDNRGLTSFAEKKQFIVNTLNQMKETQKQKQQQQQQQQPRRQQQVVVKEMPPDVVKKEDVSYRVSSVPSRPTKLNAHERNANRSSIMSELRSKFEKNDDENSQHLDSDNHMVAGKVNCQRSKHTITSSDSPHQNEEKQLILAEEMMSDVVEKEDSSPRARGRIKLSNEHQRNVSFSHSSDTMNELRSKFESEKNSQQLINDKCIVTGKVNGPSPKDSMNSPYAMKQQKKNSPRIVANEMQSDIVEKEDSLPHTSSAKSNGHGNKISSHQSGIMAELTSKFEKGENARQVNVRANSYHSHQNYPSRPRSGRGDNIAQELSPTATPSISAIFKHNIEEVMRKENESLSSELQRMKEKLSKQEEEMDTKVAELERELRKKEHEMKHLREEKLKSIAKDEARLHEYVGQLAADLDSYKAECASYRERILQKEREIAKTESCLYEEKKKVLSLESENHMLLNIAEDNVSHATSTDRAKETELAAYRDECDKYRKRVLELERKVLAVEGALDSTGLIVSALEEEKNTLSSQLVQRETDKTSLEADIESLQSKIEERDSRIKSIQIELSTLQERWSVAQINMVSAKGNADENSKTMSILESENASLMQKLEKFQTIVNRCNQVEEENLTLKKLKIDLTERHVEMSKEVLDAQGLASNTNRLQKMMQGNESYISKLQDDLAKERTTHLESVQNTRQKYTVEITALTEKLRAAEESARIAELKNYELDEKLLSIEREHSVLRDLEAHRTKSQSDQMMKLMEHADSLRRKNMECQDKNASLKHELSETAHAHNVRVKQLERDLALLEGERSKIADSLATMNMDLLQTRKDKFQETEELGRIIQTKDKALAKSEIDFANLSKEKTNNEECFRANVQQLEQSLEKATTRNNALEKQIHAIQRKVAVVCSLMRKEKTVLLSDIQNLVLEERGAMMKQLKQVGCMFRNAIEKQDLDQSVRHSVAMSMVTLDKGNIERLLWAEKEKKNNLEASLVIAREDQKILADACAKFSGCEKEFLLDAIDNMVLDSSDAKFQVKTLEVDNSYLTSNKAYLESKIEALSGHLKAKENTVGKLEAELEKNLDAMRIQLEANASLKKELETQQTEAERVVEQMRSSFDADRKSQDKIVDEIISAKEEALLREEVLLGNVDALTKEAAVHVAQVNKLTAMFNEANQERDSIASKYEASRQQVASLLDNNHSAQKKADDLINHYMKIEDELRQQLQSVQGEKTSLERKLKVVQRESDRLLGEFCTEKHGLTNIHATQVDLIKELETQIDDLTTCNTEAREKIDHLSKEVDELRQYNTELIERVDSVCSERDASSSALAVEREQYDHDLKAMEQRIESERLAHASALTELQSIFNIEKEEQATKANTQEERICTLACEAKELKEDVEKLKETREDQKRLISQLKASLKDALDESNRLESKITAEQDELSKVTNTMTSIEEENFNLNQSLHQSRSEVDKLATILALQEPDLSDLESSLQKVIEEKARLENELSDKETKLFKTMNALTHFELKLARAEQERDAHSDRAHCEITRLQNELTSQVTMHQVKEAELESQIVALKKECDVEYEKNEDYEVVTSSLKEELHTLSEENVRLSRVNANIITANEAFANENSALAVDNEQLKAEIIRLTENLATVKSKIDCVKSKIAVGKGDDSPTKSGDSMANQVKKTASELQSTVKAIKKHHDQTVKKLQSELDDARKRVKKYEGKVNDLTTLIEENACVIESLHQKLRGKSPTISSYSSPRQSYSNESEVTE